MDGGDSGAELSAEEKELIRLQTEMLRDAQGTAAEGADLNAILTPMLLEQAGYVPTLAEADVLNPEYVKAKTSYQKAREKLIAKGKRYGRDFMGDSYDKKGLGSEDRRVIDQMRATVNSTRKAFEALKESKFTTRAGDIIGATKKPDTPAEDLREENEQLLLERQNEALRGELPVNPGLLSSLEDQEEELRASLLQNLGSGYETSTPGIEALAEFGEKKEAILEASRRDDIASAGGLANDLGAYMSGLQERRFSQGQSVVGSMFGEASALAQISQGYSGPLSYLQTDRFANDNLSGGQQAGLAAVGYGAQTGNPYVAGAGALAYLFLD